MIICSIRAKKILCLNKLFSCSLFHGEGKILFLLIHKFKALELANYNSKPSSCCKSIAPTRAFLQAEQRLQEQQDVGDITSRDFPILKRKIVVRLVGCCEVVLAKDKIVRRT